LDVDEMTIVNWELDRTKPRNIHVNRVNRLLGIEIYPTQASGFLEEEAKPK